MFRSRLFGDCRGTHALEADALSLSQRATWQYKRNKRPRLQMWPIEIKIWGSGLWSGHLGEAAMRSPCCRDRIPCHSTMRLLPFMTPWQVCMMLNSQSDL